MRTSLRLGTVALALSLGGLVAHAQSASVLAWPQATQDVFDAGVASTWARYLPTVDATLLKAVQGQAGTTHGQLTIDKLDVASKDFTASPRIAFANDTVQVNLPRAGASWALTLAGHLSYDLDKKVLFFHVKKHFSEDVTLAVTNVKASTTVVLDTKDPTLPTCKAAGPLKLDFDVKVKTGSTILNVVLFFAKPFIDKLLRKQIDQALQAIDQDMAPLVGLPGPAWGTGAPAHGAFGSQPDLQKAALQVDDDIQKYHLPWNTILAVNFSDPNYGQGTPVSYGGHGDSAIWTGHYLAGEAFRWVVTKAPAAQTNSARVLSGITDLLDAEAPGGGHLSRVVVPMSYPGAAGMLSNPSCYTTTLHGQPYVADDHISRDQYLGVMHGLGCAYDFLDDPAQKKLAGDLIARIVDYLVANDWVAMQHDNKTPSAPFIQSTEKMIAFTALAAHVDPRFQKERDRVAPLAYQTWLSVWMGLLDPLNGYYGWNLGNGARYHAMRLETDPARFMALERAHAIERRGIGHHENAYFQTVDAAVDPTLATTLAPDVLDELRRWTARPRRNFDRKNSLDPTIQQDDYAVPLSFQKNQAGTSATIAPLKERKAKYVIPVEKRCATDFLWQRDPFQLDGNGSPYEQSAGVDLVLPYWMARFYKLVP